MRALSSALLCRIGVVILMALYTAYQKNDFVTAMKVLRLLAERGDANAQYNVGVMYS